jgi:hypothetical protein
MTYFFSCLRTVANLDLRRKRTNSEDEVEIIKRSKDDTSSKYDDLD